MKPELKTLIVALLAVGVMAGGFQLLGPKEAATTASSSSSTSPVSSVSPATATGVGSVATPNLKAADAYQQLSLLKPGTPAPDFKATAANGKPVALQDFAGKKNVVMVFYQGSFCSVCGAQLEGIQSELGKIEALGAEVLAVSADRPADAQKTVGEHGLSFNVLPDTDRKLINSFGVANHAKGGIAYPVVYVVDPGGKVAMAYASPDGTRMQADQIIDWLKAHPVKG
jgi:thioredoxin-dependent peroxiredoxin